MLVVAVKSEPRCKLCSHAERPAIDSWLLRRSCRETDENGERITLDYVLERFRELGVPNPTEDNVKVHWKKHCEVRTEQEHEKRQEASTQALDRILESPEAFVDIDAGLKAIFAQGVAELRARIQERGELGITIDQLVKLADTLTKRSTSDAQSELLRSLAGGLEKALGGKEQPAIELTGEVIEEGELVG